MKPQIPALGIMKTNDFGDSKFYRVACSCSDTDHDIDFEVEADDSGIRVNTYVTTKTDYWNTTFRKRYDIDNQWLQQLDWTWKDLVNGLIGRVRLTWQVWTRGYIRTQVTAVMDQQQALNYAETIKSAIQDVKDFKKP